MTDSLDMPELLKQRGFDWAIKIYSPSKEAGHFYAEKLSATKAFMSGRGIGENAPTLSDLYQLEKSNPYKLDAFIEALVTLKSAEMITASWRMIQGMHLASMDLKFESAKLFLLQLSLIAPSGEHEAYSTDDIDDMNFIRHLMKSKSGDRPIINGFFALRRPR